MLPDVPRVTQLRQYSSINMVISSFEKPGIDMTPLRRSSCFRVAWILANESAHGGTDIAKKERKKYGVPWPVSSLLANTMMPVGIT